MSEEVNAGSGENPGKGLGVTGFVISIVMFLFSWFLAFLFAAIFGAAGPIVIMLIVVLGLVLSVMGMKKSKAAGHKNGLGLVGMILSIITLAIWLIMFAAAGAVVASASSHL